MKSLYDFNLRIFLGIILSCRNTLFIPSLLFILLKCRELIDMNQVFSAKLEPIVLYCVRSFHSYTDTTFEGYIVQNVVVCNATLTGSLCSNKFSVYRIDRMDVPYGL